MKPAESNIRGGGGSKTEKRAWSKPRIRPMEIGARTRTGARPRTSEGASYNVALADCDVYPYVCSFYPVPSS